MKTKIIVATEYPVQYDKDAAIGNIPYYPINTVESDSIYKNYLKKIKEYKGIFLCGRLAEFKYYNMDICIEHALQYAESIKEFLRNKET